MQNNNLNFSTVSDKLDSTATQNSNQVSVSNQNIPYQDNTLSTGSKGGHEPGGHKNARPNSQISVTGTETGSISTSTQNLKNSVTNSPNIPEKTESLSTGSKVENPLGDNINNKPIPKTLDILSEVGSTDNSETSTLETEGSEDLFNTQIDLTEADTSVATPNKKSSYLGSFFMPNLQKTQTNKTPNQFPQKEKSGFIQNYILPK